MEKLASSLGQFGRYIIYGILSSEPTPFPVAAAFSNKLTMSAFAMDSVNDRSAFLDAQRTIEDGLSSGALLPIIDSIFPIEKVADAHRYVEQNEHFGKVILSVR